MGGCIRVVSTKYSTELRSRSVLNARDSRCTLWDAMLYAVIRRSALVVASHVLDEINEARN